MLETLVAGLLLLQEEVAPVGLQISWTKRKFSMSGHHVWPSRRSWWQQGTSTWWRTSSTAGRWYPMMEEVGLRYCDYFSLLEKNIWSSHIMYRHQGAPLQDLYPSSPALWFQHMDCHQEPSKASRCLRYLVSVKNLTVSIQYTRHTANETVRSITGCLPVSGKVEVLQAPGLLGSGGRPTPCHRTRLEETWDA